MYSQRKKIGFLRISFQWAVYVSSSSVLSYLISKVWTFFPRIEKLQPEKLLHHLRNYSMKMAPRWRSPPKAQGKNWYTHFNTKSALNWIGEAFNLGRHVWFALRRLITNSRNSAFTGGFCNHFLKETTQVDRRTKNWTMKMLLHETPQRVSKFKMANQWVKLLGRHLPLYVSQHCSILVFPLQTFLCWKVRNFLLRHKALAYFTYL